MRTIVVVPAYNEANMIGQVVQKLIGHGFEVVVVDDGSSDTTSQTASSAGAKVLRHFLNRGQGAALQTGITYAINQRADIVVTFDADGQLDADEVKLLIRPIQAGQTEVVLGSRFLIPNTENQASKVETTTATIPLIRKFVLRLATLFTRFYTGLKVTDTHNGFRAFSYSAAQKINIAHDGMAHASEILEQIAKYKLTYTEVPVTIRYTEYSLQKGQKLSSSFKILWDLLLGRISK